MPDPRKILTTIRLRDRFDAGDPRPIGRDHRAGGRRRRSWSSATCTATSRRSAKCSPIAALDRNPGRHLVLQELIHGKPSIRKTRAIARTSSWTWSAALKCQYPDRVHLILGNHELSELTGRIIAKDGKTLNDRCSAWGSRPPMAPRPARSTKPTRDSSPRCRWRSARPTACSSATRSPTSPTSTRWTSNSSRPTPGPRRR